MLASSRLGKECVEGIIASPNSLVARHLPIRLDAMLKAEQLPTSIADLDAGLTDVDADHLTHGFRSIR